MSDLATVYVRQELVPERAAPIKLPALSASCARACSSPTNILITIVSALLLWFTIIPSVNSC